MNDKRSGILTTGIVLDANGRPISGAVVRVIWPQLRDEVILAETRTGRSGRFAIDVRRPKGISVTARIRLVALNGLGDDEYGGAERGFLRRPSPEDDPRFVDGFAAVQGIVTGNAVDDPGLFVRDITENLADPRYLPFENAGVISEWKIALPPSRNYLDISTVTDVKLHLHYTALDGGRALREAAQQFVEAEAPDTIGIAFDGRGQFPEAWDAFFAGSGGEQRFVLPLRPGLLPPAARGARTPRIIRCVVWMLSDRELDFETSLLPPFPAIPSDQMSDGVVSYHQFEVEPGISLQELTVRVRESGAGDWMSLAPDQLNGMVIALEFDLT